MFVEDVAPEHSGADSFGELFDLFFEVDKGGVQAPVCTAFAICI